MQNEFRNGIDRVLECISSRRTPTMGERRHGNRRARRKLRTRRNLSRRNKGHLHVRMHNSETQNYPDLCGKKFNGPWPLIMSLLKTNANFSISFSIIPLSCPSFAEFPCARNFLKAHTSHWQASGTLGKRGRCHRTDFVAGSERGPGVQNQCRFSRLSRVGIAV
jgi:hypothetical protein